MKFLTVEQVLFIHSRVIDETGGTHGIRELGLLQAAVGRPKASFARKDLYPDIFQKGAALLESLCKNHPFLDGNKRTAVITAVIFLRLNGYTLECEQKELEEFVLDIATGKLQMETAAAWLRAHALIN